MTIIPLMPQSIPQYIMSLSSSRNWKKTQISKLLKHLLKSLLCSKAAKMEPRNASSGTCPLIVSQSPVLCGLDIHCLVMFYPGLDLWSAQFVWETRKIPSACHVNTSTVWPVLGSGWVLGRCTVHSACSLLMKTSPWFLQMK